MKICFFIMLLVASSFYSCNTKGKPGVGSNDKRVLHFITGDSLQVDPMTLLNFQGNYYLIYQAIDSGVNKQNTIFSASRDLLNWQEPKPMEFGNGLSRVKGTIVIDSTNASGLDTAGNAIWVGVLVRTDAAADNEKAVLASSKDFGKSWKIASNLLKFPAAFLQNPQNINIVWFAPEKKWIMTVALNDHVELYSSQNLQSWVFETAMGSDFFPEGVKWERASLFPDMDNDHWVLLADIKRVGKNQESGGTVYFVGSFDGKKFLNVTAKLRWLDYGENVYSSLVNVSEDGRRISMAWKNADDLYRGFVSVPRQLWVDNAGDERFIFSKPVHELDSLDDRTSTVAPMSISYKNKPVMLVSELKTPLEIYLKFNSRDILKGSFPTKFGVSFYNNEKESEQLSFLFDRFGYYSIEKPAAKSPDLLSKPVKMPFEHLDSTLTMHIIVDAYTIECFAEDGRLVMTDTYSLTKPLNSIKLFAENGDIDLISGRIIERKMPAR